MSSSDIQAALRAFLRGESTIEEVAQVLSDRLRLRTDGSAIRAVSFEVPLRPEEEVEVYPLDVQRMLRRYLKGEVDSEGLVNWARFVTLSQAYFPPHDRNDEDHYESMWYVLQQISTPELDGEVTPERVKVYLTEIEKLRT